jgi:phosphoribosylaminoimidazole-succinocarboxamide synthase
MEKRSLAYEGKAKKLYETDDKSVFLVEYLDQATALNGAKKDAVKGKGQMNNQITSQIFEKLAVKNI